MVKCERKKFTGWENFQEINGWLLQCPCPFLTNIYRMGVRNSWNGMSIYEGFLTMDLWCNGDGKKRRRKTRCNSGKIA
jgi:hypothetical protein